MVKVIRKSAFCLMAISLLLLSACSSKSTGETNVPDSSRTYLEPEGGVLTPEERQAAEQITNGIVYFAYDSFSLSDDAKAILGQKAHLMNTYPELRVLIEGNCDDRGTEEYNLALGERRARAAYDFLVQLGVNPNQIEMVSFGKLHPARVGTGEEVWRFNRRDEFKVSKPRY